MHPAPSLILFTVLSGLGFGLIAWTGLGLGPAGIWYAWTVSVASGALVAGGLGASALHLRRPDRAWRAFSQWRSSWLSREAVLAAATSAVFGAYALTWIVTGTRLAALGLLSALLAAATVLATAMIYTQLRTVPRWHTPLTPLSFLAFAATGGLLAVLSLSGAASRPLTLLALALLATAAALKAAWWHRANATRRPSPEATTALGALGTVRQFEPPHTGRNYLQDEMIFRLARRRATAVRRLAAGLGAALPALLLALLAAVPATPGLAPAALLSHLAGLLFERWLFFAEAEHAVGAYYGHR
ncbi:dimethyl sulfoxide reductase anchor subunit [Psychromarinibacter sp. C21-152]|uniref:Dimethyl sulfoxide reductase anchor subunit n=1 Tax=Psychromarinibacter sediminicola TaxID=3033385 RepID=A0AAE3NR79_9RHOB|nr:DmsC/YnfH family molybdoenzyme membrane anchor subunit [Psychromarinibacter sediminicola]MDF0600597.1 dimethyl sulfoxide reductase anchor subunit [Psychromarinibacter sediminicola]